MTTTAPAPAPPQRNQLRTVLLVVGSVLLVGIVAYLVIAVVGNATRSDASREVEITESFDDISVEVGVADVVVEYESVSDAVVSFRQNGSTRTFDFDAKLVGS